MDRAYRGICVHEYCGNVFILAEDGDLSGLEILKMGTPDEKDSLISQGQQMAKEYGCPFGGEYCQKPYQLECGHGVN